MEDEINQKIQIIVNQIDKLHIEDPTIFVHWDGLTKILTRDEISTIIFLQNLKDEHLIKHVSSVFEEISSNLQSKKFIETIEFLEQKFKHLKLHYMVEAAKNAMED